MRILYLSCHSILEYDEVSLLTELGHYVFSPGAYVEPRNPGDASLRPGLMNVNYDPDDVKAFNDLGIPGFDNKDVLTKKFVDRFDVVIVMHLPRWIINNNEAFKGKTVIWRTIGQSICDREAELAPYRARGLKIVRYSPKERTIPGFIGEDALIRFYKDPDEFGQWNGNEPYVCTFQQDFPHRKDACNYYLWEQVTENLPRKLFGPHNEGIVGWGGKVSYDQLKIEMANNRAYFYVGTHPASYTLNLIEAMLTGIPVVAIGPKFGNASYFPGHDLYEIPDIITNGINGSWSDNPTELQGYLKTLLDDQEFARHIGAAGRERAIELFGKGTIMQQWKSFLNNI